MNNETIERIAKALALRAGDAPMAVVITVDNCGVPGHIRDEVARRLKAKAKR